MLTGDHTVLPATTITYVCNERCLLFHPVAELHHPLAGTDWRLSWPGWLITCQDDAHTTTVLWPFVRDYLGEPVPEETLTHPPTILIIIQSLSASSIYHDPWHPPCSNYVLRNLFAQPLFMSSLFTSWSGGLHLIFRPKHGVDGGASSWLR